MLGISAKCNLLQAEHAYKTVQRAFKDKSTIVIPPRIERGPLDILKALSAAVQPEKGSNQPCMIPDGEAFTPKHSKGLKVTLLSLESGKKAAKWIVQNHSKYFDHKISEPFIKNFAPAPRYGENADVSETNLLEAIDSLHVSSAIQLYELLKKKEIDVSQSTKEKLLELVCFFNSQDEPDQSLLVSKYFDDLEELTLCTWKNPNFADELFKEMDQNSHTLSVYIMGMLKYKAINESRKLFNEATAKKIPLSVGVYNALLENVDKYVYHYNERVDEMQNILKLMADAKIRPNLNTMNSVLSSLLKLKIPVLNLAEAFVEEFKKLGIEPSLATYHYLLRLGNSIYKGRVLPRKSFWDLIQEVKRKTWQFSHADDYKFFTTAMSMARSTYKDVALSREIHKIFLNGHKHFISHHFMLSYYYREYFLCCLENGGFNEGFDLYESLPNTFLSDAATWLRIMTVLKNMETSQVPRLWNNFKNGNFLAHSDLVLAILSKATDLYDDSLKETASDIVAHMLRMLKDTNLVKRWNYEHLSNCLLLAIATGNENLVLSTLNEIEQLQDARLCRLNRNVCFKYIEFCVRAQNKEAALKGLSFTQKYHPLSEDIVSKVKTAFGLTESEVDQILTRQKQEYEHQKSKSKRENMTKFADAN